MAMSNFAVSLKQVLDFEGGFVDHPRDPGGATNKGVTIANYRAHVKPGGTVADLRHITDAEVEKFYRGQFWDRVQGDDLPAGADLAIFDYAVNSGVSRASKHSQEITGAAVDGIIGRITLEYIKAMHPRDFIKKLCHRRMGFLRSLNIFSTFGKGWSRRVAGVEAKALSWVSSKTTLEHDAKEARDTSNSQAGGAVATGGGGVVAPNLTDFPWWLAGIIVAVVVIPLVIRAIINAQRASALAAAAKEAQP